MVLRLVGIVVNEGLQPQAQSSLGGFESVLDYPEGLKGFQKSRGTLAVFQGVSGNCWEFHGRSKEVKGVTKDFRGFHGCFKRFLVISKTFQGVLGVSREFRSALKSFGIQEEF